MEDCRNFFCGEDMKFRILGISYGRRITKCYLSEGSDDKCKRKKCFFSVYGQ